MPRKTFLKSRLSGRWLSRGSYGIYVAVTVSPPLFCVCKSCAALTGAIIGVQDQLSGIALGMLAQPFQSFWPQANRPTTVQTHISPNYGNAVVTPLRKAASYEPRIAILGIWGDTWLTRGKYSIYVVVTGSMWRLLEILPHKISTFYCRVSYVALTRITSLVLRNTWHYVIIRHQKFRFPKFVLRGSYEAALHKGVTTALSNRYGNSDVGGSHPRIW